MQVGNRRTTGLVVATAPDVTEIRVAAGSGNTFTVPPLGSFGYIEFDHDQSGYVLSLVAGDDVIHTQ